MDYNPIASDYKVYGERARTEWEFGYSREAMLLEPLRGKKILDYGCGDGKFSRYLASLGASVVGVDVSEMMIQEAKAHTEQPVEYAVIHHDQLLPFADNVFDVVVVNFVLCTFSDTEKISSTISNLGRVLKSGGEMLVLNSNWDDGNGKNFISFELKHSDVLTPGSPVHVVLKGEKEIVLNDYYWPTEMYTSILQKNGFNIGEIVKQTASPTDESWLDEKTVAPLVLITAKKG